MITQTEIILPPYPRGFHLITRVIEQKLPGLPENGLLHLLLKHTSAGLTLNENADPSVRDDFEGFINKLIPENHPVYTHVFEGSDDITAPHETGDITYSLFLNLTESEMRTKKARFHRSKVRNAKTGKYSGGFKKYGYYVDDNGYYQVKESEAVMIRYIFDEYENGRSIMNIQKELLQRGLINSINFVRGILISEAYTGVSNEYGMERKYPPIIDVEQFSRCREIAKENNKKADKTNEIYFAKKLIKCTECGTHYR